jgi:two-component system, OmpR family, alkaline phosphatase synthesis response regulator PhoP
VNVHINVGNVRLHGLKKLKVLIIEDEPMLQDAYRHVLTYKGYAVSSASDGIEGLAMLAKHKPDVILLDVLMPHLDGRDFLKQADIKRTHPKTSVIACSNLSDQKTADFMLEHGADKVVLKSDLSPTQLVELIEEMAHKQSA